MTATPLSLLERLRGPEEPAAWDRFVRLYAPLLLRWGELQGFQEADARDLAQAVLLKLVRLLPTYRRSDGQSFRGWLFTLCRNEGRDYRTRKATRPLPPAAGLETVAEEPPGPDLEEAEYRRLLLRRALDVVRPDFGASTWNAFTRFVLQGQPAPEVAAALGLTPNAVYLARNRVLTRLRAELAGLLD